MFKAGFELFKRMDPYLSLGGYVGTALSALGITGAVISGIAASNLSWFWETFQWAGAIFVGLIGWALFGIGFNFFRSTRSRETRAQVDYWLLGAIVSAVLLIVCLVGYALKNQKESVLTVQLDSFSKNVSGPPIEWRFDKPVTILFIAPRTAGASVWIDALQIHGTNKTERPLKNISAVIIPDMIDQKMEMRVNPHGVLLKPEETATLIPPRADFDLMVPIPSSGRSRSQGLPAMNF